MAKGHLLAETKRQNFNITPEQEMELALHRATPDPPGILAIYQHGATSDLSDADIVQALANLESVCAEIGRMLVGRVIALNPWSYGGPDLPPE